MKTFLLRVIKFGMGAFLSMQVLVASSQTSTDFGQQAINAANRQIAQLLVKFRPHFPADHRNLLSPDIVRVVVAADFNAFADFDERRVKIPAQLVIETLLQGHALGAIRRDSSLRRHWEPWMRYLTERTSAAQARFEAGRTLVDDSPVQEFWAFAGLSQPPTMDSRDAVVQEQLMHDALALVVAHELGHLALGHKPYTAITQSESHRQEGDADRFAANLLRKSAIDVLPGLSMIFARFALLEEISGRPDIERITHRRAICRFYRIGRSELEHLRRNPDTKIQSDVDIRAIRSAVTALEDECTVR